MPEQEVYESNVGPSKRIQFQSQRSDVNVQQTPPEPSGGLFSRLSPSARRALAIADHLRSQVTHTAGDQIHPELLLIALNQLPNSSPQAALSAYGLDRRRLVTSLLKERGWSVPPQMSLQPDPVPVLDDADCARLPISSDTRQVLERAAAISTDKESETIRIRHLLAALLEDRECRVTQWLATSTPFQIETVLGILREAPESQIFQPEMFAYAPGIASADLPAPQDSIGFAPYAQALAEIIIKKETIPPVVFGIYGPWGSGKSTFMQYVRDYLQDWDQRYHAAVLQRPIGDFLDWIVGPLNRATAFVSRLMRRQPPRPESKTPEAESATRIVCVNFDAWAYTDSTKLWTGLVQTISARLDDEIRWWQRPVYWLRRTGWQFLGAVVLSLLPVIVGVTAALTNSLWNWAQNLELVRLLVAALGFLGSFRFLDQQTPLTDIVQGELKNVNKAEVEGVIAHIRDELRTTVQDYFGLSKEKSGDGTAAPVAPTVRQNRLKVVVFIDELDRCPLEKIVEILEAIKLFLAEDIFIVLIAVDTRVAAEAIRLHYKEVTNPELAREYLEKIIQVPIPVPTVSGGLNRYVSSLMTFAPQPGQSGPVPPSDPNVLDLSTASVPHGELPVSPEPFKPLNMHDTETEKQAVVSFAETYLDNNPRRIKRLLNTYRYVKILAFRRGFRINAPEWQQQMITWLGATMRWPVFMQAAAAASERELAGDLWNRLREMVPKESQPPDEIVKRLPTDNTVVAAFAALADNFIKENPSPSVSAPGPRTLVRVVPRPAR